MVPFSVYNKKCERHSQKKYGDKYVRLGETATIQIIWNVRGLLKRWPEDETTVGENRQSTRRRIDIVMETTRSATNM